MGGYYNPYTSGFSAAHMAAAAAAAAQQSGQVSPVTSSSTPPHPNPPLLTPSPFSLTTVAQSFPTTKMCRRHCKAGRVMAGLNTVGRGG